MKRLRRSMLLGSVALAAGLARAAKDPPYDAKVTKVVDGDSLWVLPIDAAAPVELRIRNIDAPEICQPWGREAREALAGLVADKVLYVRPYGRDPHGRQLAQVNVGEIDVGAWMVVEGHAWSIRTKWDRGPLVKEERVAQALRRGLWITPDAMAPKDFRRTHGPCGPV